MVKFKMFQSIKQEKQESKIIKLEKQFFGDYKIVCYDIKETMNGL